MTNTAAKGIRPGFPEHLQSLRNLMPELVAILEEGTEDRYAFAWLEEVKSLSITASRVENAAASSDRGMVLRVLYNGINYERSTNNLTRENLIRLAKELRHTVDTMGAHKGLNVPVYKPLTWEQELQRGLPSETLQQIPEGVTAAAEVHFAPVCEIDPFTTKPADLSAIAREYRKILLETDLSGPDAPDDKMVSLSDARVMVRQTVKTQIFTDRSRNISQLLPVSLSYSMAFSQKGKMTRLVRGGLGGLEITRQETEELQEIARQAAALDKAEKLKPGRYKVITGPDVTGVIAHEAFGHTQEGDTCANGRSIANKLRDEKVKVGNDLAGIVNYASVFSMADDEGSVQSHGTNGSYFFDHEGEFGRVHPLLDKGYLSPPMTDLLSALVLKTERTANGKRESWRRPIMTRQTNTYFTPGDKTLEELIAMAGNGYLARHAHGGMEDPKGGSLTAGTEYLEEIKDGKLTGRIFLGPSGGHIELSDPVFSLLEKIIAKSEVNHPDGIPQNKYGGCGKYHKELVEAGSGGPYILWESVNCG